LLAAVPQAEQGRRLVPIPGSIPDFEHLPSGCRFHPRCAHAVAGRCDVDPIPLEPADADADRWARCVRRSELTLTGVSRVEPA
jgi:oligopeptide/dipeptide ABC transporter ATP-binding protein